MSKCMLSSDKRKAIIDLVNREVIPAIGCTEPIAVSLCVARATEMLGELPDTCNADVRGVCRA